MIKNAKIVCTNTNPADYLRQDVERGDPAFVVSGHTLREFARCPSRWRAGYESPDSEAKRWGNLLDCLLLTPGQFEKRFVLRPETYVKDGMQCPSCGTVTDSQSCSKCKTKRVPVKQERPWSAQADACQHWAKEQEEKGLQIVTKDRLEKSETAIKRLREWDGGILAAYLDASDKQVWVAAQWHDEDTGLVIPLRCLIDLVPRADTEFCKSAGDLKTCRGAHPQLFSSQAFKMGYHWQGAFDIDMLVAATGEDRNTWCFVIQENFAPWEPNWAMYGQEQGQGEPGFLELGRDEMWFGYRWALKNYCRCLKSGKWPGYNRTDESTQGCCILRPEPFMAQKLQFGPRYEFEDAPEDETDAPPADTDTDFTP